MLSLTAVHPEGEWRRKAWWWAAVQNQRVAFRHHDWLQHFFGPERGLWREGWGRKRDREEHGMRED